MGRDASPKEDPTGTMRLRGGGPTVYHPAGAVVGQTAARGRRLELRPGPTCAAGRPLVWPSAAGGRLNPRRARDRRLERLLLHRAMRASVCDQPRVLALGWRRTF